LKLSATKLSIRNDPDDYTPTNSRHELRYAAFKICDRYHLMYDRDCMMTLDLCYTSWFSRESRSRAKHDPHVRIQPVPICCRISDS